MQPGHSQVYIFFGSNATVYINMTAESRVYGNEVYRFCGVTS
jgi:hypothetical protein